MQSEFTSASPLSESTKAASQDSNSVPKSSPEEQHFDSIKQQAPPPSDSDELNMASPIPLGSFKKPVRLTRGPIGRMSRQSSVKSREGGTRIATSTDASKNNSRLGSPALSGPKDSSLMRSDKLRQRKTLIVPSQGETSTSANFYKLHPSYFFPKSSSSTDSAQSESLSTSSQSATSSNLSSATLNPTPIADDPLVKLTTHYNEKINKLSHERDILKAQVKNLNFSIDLYQKEVSAEKKKRERAEKELEELKKKKFKFSIEGGIEEE